MELQRKVCRVWGKAHKIIKLTLPYLSYTFSFTKTTAHLPELFIQDLADIGFESFEETATGFTAYVQQVNFNQQNFDSLVQIYENQTHFTYASTTSSDSKLK